MPELPEVETTRRGIEPLIIERKASDLIIRESRFRWPVDQHIGNRVCGQQLLHVDRRGKYLLLNFERGHLLIHLGMSGSLRVVEKHCSPLKHDHIDLIFDDKQVLRLRDPRRFGAFMWIDDNPMQHKLLAHLGPEPLSEQFNGNYLKTQSAQRKTPIKSFIMDSKVVVGVGNIYANEALFDAGIHPQRAAGRISENRYQQLTQSIKHTLLKAIEAGGTTLKDFSQSDGRPGYFQQSLKVYGRGKKPCPQCNNPIQQITIAQRATYFCSICQH